MIIRSALCCSRRAGNALVIALLVVTVVATLGAGFMHITSSLATRQSVGIDSQRAFYIAEAGLAEGFQAVRMGRSGEVGSPTAPARFGDGLVWVTATDTVEGQIRLESTALCGTGRASLALVLEPVELGLGFFADEDLIIDGVVLLDGYNSTVGSYQTQAAPESAGLPLVVDRNYPYFYDDPQRRLIFYEGTFHHYSTVECDTYMIAFELDHAELMQFSQSYEDTIAPDDFMDDDWDEDFEEGEIDAVRDYFAIVLAQFEQGGPPTTAASGEAPTPVSSLGVTTGAGGQLGSNGAVTFVSSTGLEAEIWGNVVPGPGQTVSGLDQVRVSGDTTARNEAVELPMVEVPDIPLQPAVRHDDLLPMLVPSGDIGYDSIIVGPGAELILRGPCTVVIGDLILEPGAALSFDTRAGDVSLFVVRSFDLQPGSFVANSNEAPDETTVQVAATFDDPLDPAVKLDATAQFHGLLYAPDSNVRIGSEFEFFGGVVARRLEISAGARLHFDNVGIENSPIPRILSWRVIEIPSVARTVFGDPFRILGVERDALSELSAAHQLADVQLQVTYVDTSGTTRTWSGPEDQFDWSQVAKLESASRTATREQEVAVDAKTDPEPTVVLAPPPSGVRTDIADALANYVPYLNLMLTMQPLAPYSTEEWSYIQAHDPPVTAEEMFLLKTADVMAGGTGGN